MCVWHDLCNSISINRRLQKNFALRHVVILRPTSNWTSHKLHISRKSIIIKILKWERLLSLLPLNFTASHVFITDSGKWKFSYRSSYQISWNSVSWFKRWKNEDTGQSDRHRHTYNQQSFLFFLRTGKIG